jgi:DNA-binding transcriptional LysR family regulator
MPGLVKMVAAGMGVSLVTNCLQNAGVRGVIFKELYRTSNIDLCIIWRKAEHSPVLEAFLQVVREVRNQTFPHKKGVLE